MPLGIHGTTMCLRWATLLLPVDTSFVLGQHDCHPPQEELLPLWDSCFSAGSLSLAALPPTACLSKALLPFPLGTVA